jgi:hypothetical protein
MSIRAECGNFLARAKNFLSWLLLVRLFFLHLPLRKKWSTCLLVWNGKFGRSNPENPRWAWGTHPCLQVKKNNQSFMLTT